MPSAEPTQAYLSQRARAGSRAERIGITQGQGERMQGAGAPLRPGQVLDPGHKKMGPHQAAAPARAGHVLQDRQPAAVLRSYAEAQAPEVDVAGRRIHAQAGAVLPGRLRRGGPGVQALHGCAQGGPPSLRASSQSPALLLAARPRLSRVRCPLAVLARRAPLQRHPACLAPVTPGSLPGSSNLDCL